MTRQKRFRSVGRKFQVPVFVRLQDLLKFFKEKVSNVEHLWKWKQKFSIIMKNISNTWNWWFSTFTYGGLWTKLRGYTCFWVLIKHWTKTKSKENILFWHIETILITKSIIIITSNSTLVKITINSMINDRIFKHIFLGLQLTAESRIYLKLKKLMDINK